MTMGETIDVADLPSYLRESRMEPLNESLAPPTMSAAPGALEEQERRLVQEALEKSASNQSQAARMLRIGRDALRYKMKKYGL
jgi:DNA-binding NtrC family response regulator